MSTTPLDKRSRLQPGVRALVLNAPPGYAEVLGALPDGTSLAHEAEGTYALVHLFAKDSAELQRLGPPALRALEDKGILWVSYPKRSAGVETDLTRDRGWELLTQAGLRPVTQVSVDDTWSALRWRPLEQVGR